MKLNTKYEMHGAGKAPLASWKKYMLVCGSKVSQFLERFQVRVPVPVLIRIRICVRTPFSILRSLLACQNFNCTPNK